MFTNLIESDSHRKEFKRRSSFFLATVAAYTLILFGAGVASVLAYDAHLEAQTNDLVVLNWVPPITPVTPTVRPRDSQPIRRSTPSNAPVDRTVTESVRTSAVAQTNDPTRVPDNVGTKSSEVPPVTGPFHLGTKNVDPPTTPNTPGTCVTCTTTPTVVKVDDTTTPPPVPVKPPSTVKMSQGVLKAMAISLPQPTYPAMAKQIHLQGPVTVQILVGEDGRVLTAQAISGHPLFLAVAKDAAMRARFTATKLSGQPVKVQGLITYNFVMQ